MSADRTMTEAPWPIVSECHWPAPALVKRGHSCQQCDGSHDHVWAAWHDHDPKVTRVADYGVPVRCRICGGRKCDRPVCRLRRHHRAQHEEF